MNESLKEYREHLVRADQKSQEDYDKTLIKVATSSLGVSLVFVRGIIGSGTVHNLWMASTAWGMLAASIALVLLGFYLSRYALRAAIKQVGSEALYETKPGGKFATVVEFCNAASGLLLIVGISMFVWFASQNLDGKIEKEQSMTKERTPKGDGQRGYVPPPPPRETGDLPGKGDAGYIPPPPPPKNPPPTAK